MVFNGQRGGKKHQRIKSKKKGFHEPKIWTFGGNVLFGGWHGVGGSFLRNSPKRRYVNRNTYQ